MPESQVPGEEALRAVELKRGYVRVQTGIGVERLLRGREGVEERKGRLARNEFVIPLEQELDGNGDPRRSRSEVFVTREPEHGGGYPRLRRDERNSDCASQRHSPESDWSEPWALEFGKRVKRGAPLGNGSVSKNGVAAHDDREHRFAR